MLYRKVPQNGDELSILGFGCMRLPMKDGAIDEERARNQLRFAIDRGVNYIDTAWPYHGGASEEFVGRALQDGYREKVKLATKLPSFLIEKRDDMDRYLDAQLEKLASDHIDYYLVHTLNGPLWKKLVDLGIHDFLDKAQQDGRIVNTGFSYHGMMQDFAPIIDDYPWVFCQIQYNYLDSEYQAGTAGLRYAASKNIAVIIMEPLRGGNLGAPLPPPDIDTIWNTAPVKRSPVEWALLWLWDQPEVTVVLSGMNEEKHIEQNLAIAGNGLPHSLSTEERQLIDKAADTYRTLMKVGCTGCGYCMPCPSNVMIPICFEVYNTMHMFKQEDGPKFSYAIRMSGELADGVSGFASQCIECGECLEKCPQEIAIPDMLAEVAREMEDEHLDKRLQAARKMLLSKTV